MKADIIRIGNSHGIRIPKPILKQLNLRGQVAMEMRDGGLVISPLNAHRSGWAKQFSRMTAHGDDRPLLEGAQSAWDRDEWVW